MDYYIMILIAISAYLLGSLNFAIVISKWFLKNDIRQYGSKNAGATNSLRVMGAKFALLVLFGDMLKGFVAVSIGEYFFGQTGALLAGLFVILGHVFPLYFNFKGGKGVATAAAVILAFDFRMFLILVVVFFIVLIITKFVSLSSIIASTALPICMVIFYKGSFFLSVGLLINLFIIYLHRANIVRIINHEESKISFKKKWVD